MSRRQAVVTEEEMRRALRALKKEGGNAAIVLERDGFRVRVEPNAQIDDGPSGGIPKQDEIVL